MSSLIPQNRRTRFGLVVVIGLAAIAVLALVLYLISPTGSTTQHGPATPSPTGLATSKPPVKPSTSASATAPVVLPTSEPAGISWILVGQVAVPVSATDGPANINGCKATGYARTPVGALVAATQISTRAGYYAGRSCWESTITGQFVPSADRDALLKILLDADAQKVPGAVPGELSQLAAFRYLSYTNDTAVIGLVRRTPQGSYTQTTLILTWSGGDWKLVAPAGGLWTSTTSHMSGLTGGFTWGAR